MLDPTIQKLIASIGQAESLESLEVIKVALLGKSGVLTDALKSLRELDGEERRTQGERINALKDEALSALQARLFVLESQALSARLTQEWQDMTLPPMSQEQGKLHPLPNAIEELLSIFSQMGFDLAEGPHIEDDYHNFTALNTPDNHPARQATDTFYLPAEREGKPLLLRTQTSGVQIRSLATHKPPVRIVSTGRVFRSDYDQTHTPNFHQLEVIVIEPGIHMGHLKGVIQEVMERFFNLKDVSMRFRPNHFPFTEPSAEVDIQARRADGKVTLGEGDDWLEVLGCGMIHPKVLENCGIDPNEHQGFAIGMGIERLAMLKYGITDLRAFYDADLRWLQHFGFSTLQAAPCSPIVTA
jgi:phenylalanyl-tRNA synthetase alpha chain